MPHDSAFAQMIACCADMQRYWAQAELEAHYALSIEETRSEPMQAKLRRRADERISLNLSRTTTHVLPLKAIMDKGLGPTDVLADILRRIANTETTWKKLLTVVRAQPVLPDTPSYQRAIAAPEDLPAWLLQLDEWSHPEAEVIADLRRSILQQDPRTEESLDFLQWSAEDDLDAIALVLRLAQDWAIAPETKTHLDRSSAAARAQLEALIGLVAEARPFTFEIQLANKLARSAATWGLKLN